MGAVVLFAFLLWGTGGCGTVVCGKWLFFLSGCFGGFVCSLIRVWLFRLICR